MRDAPEAPVGPQQTASCCWSREFPDAADCASDGASATLLIHCSRHRPRPRSPSKAEIRLERRQSVIIETNYLSNYSEIIGMPFKVLHKLELVLLRRLIIRVSVQSK